MDQGSSKRGIRIFKGRGIGSSSTAAPEVSYKDLCS